eukprot:TRINITY_DN5007_c0_g1_i5.p1 TRINITY_DN5007_c0_g1~~TRINITY_DN5007_c0_g1_i5.p1  ORF type:complete len:180 (-),score=53.98 TRINITY_DN5007_c0_g1_i5:116-655(-)
MTPEQARLDETEFVKEQEELEQRRAKVHDAYISYHSRETLLTSGQPQPLDDAVAMVDNAADEHHSALEERRMRSLALAEHEQQTRTQLTQALAADAELIKTIVAQLGQQTRVMTDLVAIEKQRLLLECAKAQGQLLPQVFNNPVPPQTPHPETPASATTQPLPQQTPSIVGSTPTTQLL